VLIYPTFTVPFCTWLMITSVPLAILYDFFLDRFIAGFTSARSSRAGAEP